MSPWISGALCISRKWDWRPPICGCWIESHGIIILPSPIYDPSYNFGILRGWYGVENGQKPEMEKKWKSKWKTAPSWTGAKMAKKWPKKRIFEENSLKNPLIWAIFLPFLPLSSLGPFSISISIFFPFPAFGRFPCHTSPAGSQI